MVGEGRVQSPGGRSTYCAVPGYIHRAPRNPSRSIARDVRVQIQLLANASLDQRGRYLEQRGHQEAGGKVRAQPHLIHADARQPSREELDHNADEGR